MLVETLTIAAGRFQFTAGEELEFSDKEAKELIACGAAREVKPEKVDGRRSKAADSNQRGE
jgi:hypothetical protein